ncbi:SDR family NAD(P)-dependent oxidoreductase [Sphingomonas sp.]|uniref:SDR family NAD(P)-dependent oxidoreductase n=1 Tax=Sphingomonas sp. TaxID=28214 RepID=UPI003B004DD4
MRNLGGKTVLVTGGGAGIGEAIVRRFVAEGARVMIADIDAAAGKAVADVCDMPFVQLDVGDVASFEQAIAATVVQLGRLDILVNNAGVASLRAPIHASTLENWHRVINVNLNGVFYGMRSALARFVEQGSGVIVNLSSIAAMVAFPELPPYNAAKAGVSQLTREAAVEYARYGIRVNAVAPTGVWTPMNARTALETDDPAGFEKGLTNMNPMPGTASAEDIAAAVAFLASDDARFISGVTLPVDGGYTAV